MKHILSLILAAVLIFSCSITAFSVGLSGDGSEKVSVSHTVGNSISSSGGSQDITVSHEIGEGYVVVIPEALLLSAEEARLVGVSVFDVAIGKSQTLDVSVSSTAYNDGWQLTARGGFTLEYSITKDGSDVVNGQTVLSCPGGTSSLTIALSFSMVDTDAESVSYTDTLTFTVSVNG